MHANNDNANMMMSKHSAAEVDRIEICFTAIWYFGTGQITMFT